MTIETYCNKPIKTLLILVGTLHPDNILSAPIEEGAMTCIECSDENVSIRLIGGTAQLGSIREEPPHEQ